jgi:2-polyprenyl-3-methyl-5-hydroxy-6-metoxy-1,4-benzoquinol methylase
MPISRPDAYSDLFNFLYTANPKSILDVGIGFGHMGVMFRVYTDIRWARMKNWKTELIGMEIDKDYINPIWHYVYDAVYFGDATKLVPELKRKFDLVFLGDIVEHLEEESSIKLVKDCIEKANKYVVITTPAIFRANKNEAKEFNNPHEEHKWLFDENKLECELTMTRKANQKLIIIKTSD